MSSISRFRTLPPAGRALAALLWIGLAASAQGKRFDVKQYGATGDGNTDDQAAIEKAVAAAQQAGGGTIYFPAGTYVHHSVIAFGSNMTVQGDSPAQSILQASDARNSTLSFINASNCGVNQLGIRGTGSKRLLNDESSGIFLKKASRCTITQVDVRNVSSAGILIAGSSRVRVERSHVQDTLADGIHVVGGSSDVVVNQNTAENTGDDSFAAVAYERDPQTNGVTISNNVSIRSHARGAACIGALNCTITGNTIKDPGAHGIAVAFETAYHTHHPAHVTVTNNEISGVHRPGMNGILVDAADDVTLDGNTVNDSNTVFIHHSSRVQVRNMRIENPAGSGILVRDSQSVAVEHNRIRGARGRNVQMDNVSGGSDHDNDH